MTDLNPNMYVIILNVNSLYQLKDSVRVDKKIMTYSICKKFTSNVMIQIE